jgi:hypothetical protein
MTRWWRKLHNEELCNLYSLPSIIKLVKSRSMRWEGHIAQMGVKRACRILERSGLSGTERIDLVQERGQWYISSTSGGRSVGIVRSRTRDHRVFVCLRGQWTALVDTMNLLVP